MMRAMAVLAKKKQRTMTGYAPVECSRSRSVEGKGDPNSRSRHCFDGSKKVKEAQTAQLSMIYNNVTFPDMEKMLRAEKLKHRFANVILKAKLLLHSEADVQEKPASRLTIRSGILPQRSFVKKLASRPAIGTGILQQRSSAKTELRRELELKRKAARAKVRRMKRTVDLAENLDALKELERVFGRSPWVMEAFHGSRRENPLEKLGLFLKDTSLDKDIEADLLDRGGEIY